MNEDRVVDCRTDQVNILLHRERLLGTRTHAHNEIYSSSLTFLVYTRLNRFAVGKYIEGLRELPLTEKYKEQDKEKEQFEQVLL